MSNPQQNIAAAASQAPPAPLPARPARRGGGAPRPEVEEQAHRPEPPSSEPSSAPEAPTRETRSPLRRLVAARWLLALPALLLTLYAGQLVEQARTVQSVVPVPPTLAWFLFGVAALLMAVAAWPARAVLPAGPSAFLGSLRGMPRPRRTLFLGLLGGSLLLGLASLPLFWMLNAPGAETTVPANWPVNTGSWLLYIVSLLLFGAAFVVWERTTRPPEESATADPSEDRLPGKVEWIVMAALFGLAFVFRVPNLDFAPPGLWFDEAYSGLVAGRLFRPEAFHQTFVPDIVHFGALYFYFQGIAIKLFGNDIWVLRIIPALSGALLAPLVYLLGARLYGWRAGLAAGGLVAVSAWNITFSRFGIVTMFTVALDVAVFLLMAQALRTGRLGYYASAGVLLGLSMQTYYVARLVPLILIALLLHRLIAERGRLVRSVRAGAVVFAVGALLAFIPVGTFALERPFDYNSRLDTVSIFNPQYSGNDPAGALGRNLSRHLLMFNWQGDGNGRHNLPGAPMLDWVTASLFFAGFGLCVVRAWRWQYAFPVLWFAAAISGGVLSIPYEAPQSHRTIENSVVTVLVAGIFLGEAWRALAGIRGRGPGVGGWVLATAQNAKLPIPDPRPLVPIAVSSAAILAFVWWVGSMNIPRYFNVQVTGLSVVKDMYAREAQAALSLRSNAPTYDVYMSPTLRGHSPTEQTEFPYPTLQYLAPGIEPRDWTGMHLLPLATANPNGVVLILDYPSVRDVGAIAKMYPNARFHVYTAPGDQEPLVTTITIPKADLEAIRGVLVADGSVEPTVASDFSNTPKGEGVARLSTSLKVDQFGSYSFEWRRDAQGQGGQSEIVVDGYKLSSGQAISLAVGLHSVVVSDTAQSGAGTSRLLWSSGGELAPVVAANLYDPRKIEPRGLLGLYRPGVGFDDVPLTGQVDPIISAHFKNTPLPRPYTTEWIGQLYIPEDGSYMLGTEQLNTSRLFLDGREIINNPSVNSLMQVTEQLTRGWHDIRLLFQDLERDSHVYLYWAPPGRPQSIIPSAFLRPSQGEQATPPDETSLPTLAESDGQIFPADRTSYTPQRQGQPPVSQPPPPSAAQQPPPQQPASNPPAAPVPDGKPLAPLFTADLPRPRAVAADASGNIYVFAEGDSKVHKLDPQGKETASWDVKDKDGKALTEGSAITVLGERVLVLDSATSEAIRFSLDGTPEGSTVLCSCFFARAMAPAGDGNIWVADTGNNRVLKVAPEGGQKTARGEKGSGPGQLFEPAGVWQAPDGTLYVADISNGRVQTFGPDLSPLKTWPIGLSVPRDGNRLTGDAAGNVLVTQSEGRAVVMYNKDGTELSRWVHTREGAAVTPSGIAPSGNGNFVVLYPGANLVAIFKPQ